MTPRRQQWKRSQTVAQLRARLAGEWQLEEQAEAYDAAKTTAREAERNLAEAALRFVVERDAYREARRAVLGMVGIAPAHARDPDLDRIILDEEHRAIVRRFLGHQERRVLRALGNVEGYARCWLVFRNGEGDYVEFLREIEKRGDPDDHKWQWFWRVALERGRRARSGSGRPPGSGGLVPPDGDGHGDGPRDRGGVRGDAE